MPEEEQETLRGCLRNIPSPLRHALLFWVGIDSPSSNTKIQTGDLSTPYRIADYPFCRQQYCHLDGERMPAVHASLDESKRGIFSGDNIESTYQPCYRVHISVFRADIELKLR